LSFPVTVVTVAFGNSKVVRNWAERWSCTGASCLVCDNGGQLSSGDAGRAGVLPYEGNNGFGAGINRAVEHSSTPIVLVTNPDTLPGDEMSLRRLLELHSSGALTGGRTLATSGEEVHSTGVWPSRSWVRSQIFGKARSLWKPDRYDWLQGSLIMVNRDDFLDLGGFSERFPLYFEDVDLCARARKRGMKIRYCRESSFVHDEGSGSSRVTATRLSCFHWGMLEYFKAHDPGNAEAVRRLILLKCILRMAALSLRDAEAVRGYRRALRSIVSGVAPSLPGAVDG